MNPAFQTLMNEATQLTRAGQLMEATHAIQRALNGNADSSPLPAGMPASAAFIPPHVRLPDSIAVLDSFGHEIQIPVPASNRAVPGSFTSGSHTLAAQTRRYKLFSPPESFAGPLPLVVMLHGCTQNPDDFAAGTGMNDRAREQGFYVLYPEQPHKANSSGCWNWFKHTHQRRGSGEPAVLVSMTQTIMKEHNIDPRRVYIAGLSAGGAMAAIIAAQYPDVFAAVGVHSGLPAGAARDLPQALAIMKSGVAGPQFATPLDARKISSAPESKSLKRSMPTIVFHGDQDHTVHPLNGTQVFNAVAAGDSNGQEATAAAVVRDRVVSGQSDHGRRFTRTLRETADGKVIAEHWTIHGAGHAWSGGRAEGSYTDAKGPDATGEMLRFFLANPRA